MTKKNAAEQSHPMVVILDSALAQSSEAFVFHAASSEKSIFLSGKDVATYLESTGVAVQVVDFAKLSSTPTSSSAPAAATAAATSRTRNTDAAKIPEAELIGITVRKEGDFSEWYQQVLKKGDMLEYYDVSGCYILKPWSYNVWQAIQST